MLFTLQLLAELRHLVAHFRLAARFGKRFRTAGNYHYLPRDLAVVAEPLRSIQRRTGELVTVNLLVAGSRRKLVSQPFNIAALCRALSNVGNERGFSQLCYRGAFYSPLHPLSSGAQTISSLYGGGARVGVTAVASEFLRMLR
jgi:hypothetical protein